MPLFRIKSNHVEQVHAQRFDLEKNLQNIIEQNLDEIFGIHLVASEYVIRGEQRGRIDTLCLDRDGAPTIIEYKRDKNENVLSQGQAYLTWLDEHRGDFEIAAHKALDKVWKDSMEFNWSRLRLIIVAQEYTPQLIAAAKNSKAAIELWQYVRYGNDLFYLNPVYGQPRKNPAKDLKIVTKVSKPDLVAPEALYTIEYHLDGKTDSIRQIFEALRQKILALAIEDGEIIETPNKLYISYRHGKNFCEIQVMAKNLKLHLDIEAQSLIDPQKFSRDVSNVGHWETGHTEVKISELGEVEYVMTLIEQSYRLTL